MAYYTFPHTHEYEGDVGWMLRKVVDLLKCCDSMEAWRTAHEAEYQELRALYDDLVAGRLPADMESALRAWVTANAADLVGEAVRYITVGLNDDGRIIVTMPDSWDAIEWRTTGYDIDVAGYDYGHLVIMY